MYPYKRIPANKGIVKEIEGKYYSPRLKKVIPYWIAIPVAYQDQPLPVVYFLHGRNGTRHLFRDLGGPGVMERYLGDGGLPYALVALTGAYSISGVNFNTYWVDGAGKKTDKWKTLLLKEMIPWIEKTHHIGGKTNKRMIAGISMGAHGAYQLALNSRGFRCVAGHSLVVRDYPSMNSEFPSLFGGPKEFAKRDPLSLIKRYKTKRQVPFKQAWVDIGGNDDRRFLTWALNFKKELVRLGFSPKHGDVLDVGQNYPRGDHTYLYWTRRLPEYLDWYGECFKEAKLKASSLKQ